MNQRILLHLQQRLVHQLQFISPLLATLRSRRRRVWMIPKLYPVHLRPRESSMCQWKLKRRQDRHQQLRGSRIVPFVKVTNSPFLLVIQTISREACSTSPSASSTRIGTRTSSPQAPIMWRMTKEISSCTDVRSVKVKDEVGRVVRYSCDVRGCKEKKVGYRTFVLHKLVEHGGLRALIETDTRPGADYLFGKIVSGTANCAGVQTTGPESGQQLPAPDTLNFSDTSSEDSSF